jgi:hypothetical protein
VEPFGLGNGVFDSYMIYFSLIISALSLGVEISVGTSGDCEDCVVGWKGVVLLQGLDLRWRWRRWVGFDFDLGVGVVLRWVGDLWNCYRVCYLGSWRRVCYLWSWQRLRVVGCGVMI